MATFNYSKINLAAAQIPSAITESQTSITVDASESAVFPFAPFFATIMPAVGVPNALNSEIVQVTAVNKTSGALTITRAQRGTTAKAQDAGAVIVNGMYVEDLVRSQAFGKSFFSATLSSSVYYIQDARLTTMPENGDSIRVVFGSNWTSGTPKLSLNSGTAYNIYAGNNITASHGTATTPALVKTGVIYELTYYNGAWYILNLVGNSSITSSNIDWATLDQSTSNVGSSYVKIGPLLICWGYFQATGIPTGGYSEKTFTVTFPKTFSRTPQVIVGNDDIGGFVGEYALAHTPSTNKCEIIIGRVRDGGGTECRCGWVAIGAA